MPLSSADAEILRSAIQDLLFYARHRPTSLGERKELGNAWQTVERLTNETISVPGEDAKVWSFRFRQDAWKVYGYALAPTGTWPAKALKRLKKCQDTLRIIPTPDGIDLDAPASSSTDAVTNISAEGDAAALAAYLTDHPNATEDDALAAVNATVAPNVKKWTLDRLRKSDTWKGHQNVRLRAFYRDNPKASIDAAAAYMGLAKSTVSKMSASKEEMDRRRQSKPPSKARKRGNLSARQLATLEAGKPRQNDPKRDALHAACYTADGGADMNPAAFRSLLLNLFDGENETDGEYRRIINRLDTDQLERLKGHMKTKADPSNAEMVRLIVEQWLDDLA